MDCINSFRLLIFWTMFLFFVQSEATVEAQIATGHEKYVVITPNFILASSNYTILIGPHPAQPPVPKIQLSVKIFCHPKIGQQPYNVSLGPFDLSLSKPRVETISTPSTLFTENYDTCVIILLNADNQQEIERRQLSLFSSVVDPNHSKIFLQLDKPAYKPLDTVRLRIVILNRLNLPDLLPQDLRVTFYDPSGVAMKKWPNPNNRDNLTMDINGLISLELPLADELVFGTWKIEITANGNSLSKDFLIQKYVLPKFYLKFFINPKPYLTAKTGAVNVDVQARYTYGKALKGRLNLALLNPQFPDLNLTKNAVLNNGKASFAFNPISDLGKELVRDGATLELHATVTEEKTSRLRTDIYKMPVFDTDPFKITWLNPVSYYKAGVPTSLQFAISDFENMPVVDRAPNALTMTSGLVGQGGVFQTICKQIPINGLANFDLNLPEGGSVFDYIKIQYKDTILNLTPPKAFKPREDNDGVYLKLFFEGRTEELKRGDSVRVRIETTKVIHNPKVNYILWSGQEIVGYQTGLTLENGAVNVHLPIDKPYTQLSMVAYVHHQSADGNAKIISGTLRIPTNNYLEMNLGESKLEVEPGTNQTIFFKTHPGSTIAMRGVDQSLLLLSRDKAVNDIHPSDVPYNPFYHTYGSGVEKPLGEFNSDFEELGLLLLTNSPVKKSKRQVALPQEVIAAEARHRPQMSDYVYFDGKIRTRTHFPETWLWNELLATDFTTVYSKGVPIVPDTLTSWYVTALSLNRHSGLAVTQMPSLLTVFRPFFLTLNLPYAVTQGERFELQVLVHNYLNHTIQAEVTFFNDVSNFRFIDSRERELDNVTRMLAVDKATVGNVSFVIMPLVSGDIQLSLRAVTEEAGDAIIRPLRVEVPGIKVWNPVNNQLYDGPSAMHTEKFTIRRRRSKRGTTHKLTVTGTPMKSLVWVTDSQSKINNLIGAPTGCGEQQMINFARNILALDWLRANQKENPALEKIATDNILVGYQKQMTYFNAENGYFHYFDTYQYNEKDNTWLTAYVLRILNQAKKYITIDKTILTKGLEFLLRQQDQKTGEFKGTAPPVVPKYGHHLHRMRVSASANYGLTAYVTLAIIEITADISGDLSRTDKIKYTTAKAKGLSYISSEVSLMDSDTYNLILVATTLAAAGDNSRHRFFEQISKRAKTSPDSRFKWWEMSSEAVPSALTVEMTAYGLLTHLWMNKDTAAESLPIVRWLLHQKTEGGGFKTTQDTVVAFTALSKFAERALAGGADDAVSVSVLNKDEALGNLFINRTNRDISHQVILPRDLEDDEFTVVLKGKGKAYIQYTEVHHTEKILNTSNYYVIGAKLTKDTDEDRDHVFTLEFCLNQGITTYNATGQVYAEIKLPTGFTFEEDEIPHVEKIAKKKAGSTVQKIETKEKGHTAVVYYATLNNSQQCIKFPVYNYIPTTNRHKGHVRVTDYYNPKYSDTSTIFVDRITTTCDLCLVTGACDVISGCIQE